MIPTKVLAILTSAAVAAVMMAPTPAHAQRRRVIRVAPVRPAVVVGAYYRPYYDPWYGYGFPYWYPPFGYGVQYGPSSSIRFQVEPKQAEVFVDGYYTGTVDDFDGFFQRLRIEPGQHEIELYLPGHHSVRRSIYLQPGGTFRIRHVMEPLKPGETADPRPLPPASAPPPAPQGPYGPFGRPRAPVMGPNRPDPSAAQDPQSADSAFGALAIRVQPGDADIVIDGERWQGPGAGDRLVIQVPEGEHRIEVRKSGFDTFASTVQVRRGETATLNISLTRE